MFGFITGLVATCAPILKAISVAATVVTAVAHAVTAISHAFGLTKSTNAEELGEKALQAEEQNIRPEDFQSYEDYVKEVEAINLDPERSSRWTKEQKEAKAAEVGTMLLAERFGQNAVTLIGDVAKHPDFFTPQRATHYLQEAQGQNIDLTKISDLLNNKTTDLSSVIEAKDLMYDIEKSLNPNLSMNQHNDNIMELRAR